MRSRSNKRTFGQVIHDQGLQLDLSQQQIARRTRVSAQFVGNLESGKKCPSVKTVARLAEILKLDRHELFFLAIQSLSPGSVDS